MRDRSYSNLFNYQIIYLSKLVSHYIFWIFNKIRIAFIRAFQWKKWRIVPSMEVYSNLTCSPGNPFLCLFNKDGTICHLIVCEIDGLKTISLTQCVEARKIIRVVNLNRGAFFMFPEIISFCVNGNNKCFHLLFGKCLV